MEAASSYIPASIHALATKVLLARHGLSMHLRIGVRRDSAGEPPARVWVKAADSFLIGNTPTLPRFAPIHPREIVDR